MSMSMGKYNPLLDTIAPHYSNDQTIAVNEIRIGGMSVTDADIVKFKKLLDFMDFAMGASPELRNLMVAYEAKQRILK